VLKGQADMAGLSEFVMVGNVLQKQKVSILGTFNKSLTTNLIGLRNRGISKASDLAGKRIGLGRGTSGEFYLGRFLELQGANIKDVVIVDLPPSKWQDAIFSGDVDAIVGWVPFTTRIQERLINETVNWQVQSGQPVFGIIVGSNDWIANHPDTIVRFWKSLALAEEFLTHHPDEAKAIMQKRLNYDGAYIEMVWPQYTFSLSLDQPLITAMEDETRWMISNNLTTEKQMPDFLDYIYEVGLKAVKPEAVKIIR
jgi:NitT/TauT family transport system substrate-binding protein